MALLLSTANDLFWLGRYMQRTGSLQSRLFLHHPANVEHYLKVIGVTPPKDTEDVKDYLRQTTLATHFEHVNDNVQTVRGVIDQDAYELFNSVTRLRESGSLRAACFQLQACVAAMLAQEDLVSLFWRLGDAVESLDEHIRFGDKRIEHFRHLALVATELPENTAWDELKQPAQAMVFTMDIYQFQDWVNQLQALFEGRGI